MMACEISPEFITEPWSYGILSDGRIFFANDETRTTTWLHPVKNVPVGTGNQTLPDLPKGWERGVTPAGFPYYIDHNKQETTFVHPVTKESLVQTEAIQTPPKQLFRPDDFPRSLHSPVPTLSPTMDGRRASKKKSTNNNLRSPAVKRSSQSPVAMQGWLYKQGSDGLMLWKKRWFVLSDFCLFYYKGPEEDKTLGSILLPSYKISPCTADDRVYRKYAFKAEHHNMRTYYFASETTDTMHMWMNAMSLASILQRNSGATMLRERGEQASVNSLTPNEDEDSGFTSYHSRRQVGSPQHDGNSTLASSYTSESYRYRADGSTSDMSHHMVEGGYLGSADKYPNGYGSVSDYRHPSQAPLKHHAPPKPKRTPADRWADDMENQMPVTVPTPTPRTRYPDWEVVPRKPPQRRTPDPYARTAVLSMGAMPGTNDEHVHRNLKSVQRPHSTELGDFEPSHEYLMREARTLLDAERYDPPNYKETTARSQNECSMQAKNSMYPMSSMGNPDMRSSPCQDSNYNLHKMAHKSKKAAPNSAPQNTSFDSYLTTVQGPHVAPSDNSNVGMRVKDSSHNHHYDHEHEHSQYALQPPSHQHHAIAGEEDDLQCGTDVPRGTNASFLRSASARLPSVSAGTLGPHYRSSREKERDRDRDRDPSGRWSKVPQQMQMLTPSQREASMKRLLEWKRRMLQSPLTKKHVQRNLRAPPIGGTEDGYCNQALLELGNQDAMMYSKGGDASPRSLRDENAHKENSELMSTGKQEDQDVALCPRPAPRPSSKYPLRNLQDPRRVTGAVNCYNSYSSDDEESVPGSLRDSKRSARGWLSDAPTTSEDPRALHILREVANRPHLTSLATDDVKAGLSFSAGDLLGKTHEELVLLLIQLRRDQTNIELALKRCRMDLDTEQRLLHVDSINREQHIARHKDLLDQHEDLTHQFDLARPLVNLVDNMVKLGALYGAGGNGTGGVPGYEDVEFGDELLDGQLLQQNSVRKPTTSQQGMIEFSRQLQEQRLLQSEKGVWEQPHSAQCNLQDKLENLCKLDQAMQEESSQLFGLQQDKDNLERAIEGLRERAGGCKDDPSQLDRIRRQLWMAENELAKVTTQLSLSSKKLEETAAENIRLENEIMGLRQKVQASLKHHQALGASPLPAETSRMKAQLETELKRITTVMEDLANQRAELCKAMEHVKDRNHELLSHVRPSPTGVAGSAPLPGKKLPRSTYMETDLDTMETHDIVDAKCIPDNNGHNNVIATQIPLYVNSGQLDDHSKESKANADDVDSSFEYLQSETAELYELQDITDADDKMKRFYGILPKEKPAEIKTVRIVKRESERRNKGKDRRKVSYDENSLRKDESDEAETEVYDETDIVDASELDEFQRSMSLPRNYGRFYPPGLAPGFAARPTPPNSLYANTVNRNTPKYYRTPSLSGSDSALSAHERLFGQASPTTTLSIPTFKSEAAKRIVEETAKELAFFDREREVVKEEAGSLKRRHKRRHYTISSSQPVSLETDAANAHKLIHARSRDDLDMERCLRVANTPDVVKSTIKKNDMFDESTIDRELGLPQKIVIPERYVEEEEEVQLTVAERLRRLQKAESIRKMLSEGTVYSDVPSDEVASVTLKKKFEAEKKQREHLLALNQMIAQEVMQKSKAVAANISLERSNN